MVWILRSKTRTLAKWVMSPANLNIFIFDSTDRPQNVPHNSYASFSFCSNSLSLSRSLAVLLCAGERFGSELDLGKQAVHPVHDVNTYAYQFSYGKRDLKNKK
jgi:hypothetical protein